MNWRKGWRTSSASKRQWNNAVAEIKTPGWNVPAWRFLGIGVIKKRRD
jgi:hypothetical protein